MGAKGQYQSSPAVFWSRAVEDQATGCLVWHGTVTSHGYGHMRFGGKTWRAHRLAFTLANGPIPDGLFVCHSCDNPRCVNPAHLFLGTNSDNIKDCVRKGRHTAGALLRTARRCRGEENGQAKITAADVKAIRRMRENGFRFNDIARRYPLHEATIGQICRRDIWRHVE